MRKLLIRAVASAAPAATTTSPAARATTDFAAAPTTTSRNGHDGNDDVNGDSGNDRLSGRRGDDFVRGGRGRDRTSVRDGRSDRVSCGPGNDTVKADRKDKVSRPASTSPVEIVACRISAGLGAGHRHGDRGTTKWAGRLP